MITQVHWLYDPGAAPRDQRVLVAVDRGGRLAVVEAVFRRPFGMSEEPDPRWETMRDGDGMGGAPVDGEVYAWALVPRAPEKRSDDA